MTKSARKRVATFAKIQTSSTRLRYMIAQVDPIIVPLGDTPAIPVLLNQANKI